jgi:hypothetical protein
LNAVVREKGENDRLLPGEGMQENQNAELVESLVTSKAPAHTKGRPITIGVGKVRTEQAEPGGKIQGGLNGDQVATKNRK